MLTIKGKKFFLNGEEFHIYSGAMHYFRVPCEYWEDRLLKLKASGLNTVETYVAWNCHEPKKGKFNFEGICDIVKFIETAKKVGLYVIVRPGPYICAEWDFGGFPAWLLKDKNIRLRCYDKKYMKACENWFKILIPKLVPYLETNGGNIIAMQVENEYGSFGMDKKYLYWLRELIKSLGVDIQLFTSDGETKYFLSGGGIKEDLMVANFGGYTEHRFDDLKILQPDKPLMCGEHWCGWFDHWGSTHNNDDPETLGRSLDGFFKEDANFNLYMFHGGTNFGFYAGANYNGKFCPTTTSYDYDAPLSECGAYTEKYFVLRDRMAKHLNKELPELPPDTKTQSLGNVKFTEFADLQKVYKKFAVHKKSHLPHYMEHYDQNSGLILYSTVLKGWHDDFDLVAYGVHDIAYIYVDGELKYVYDRTKLKGKELYEESFTVRIEGFNGEKRIDILVEALGRINYARRMYDRKGLDEIYLNGQAIIDWDVYSMELNTAPENIKYTDKPTNFPCFMRGHFTADKKEDTFIDMRGFSNAVVYVNGKNYGRYLKRGPQRTIYLPGCYLKDENEIVILELEKAKKKYISFTDKPIFD